MFKNILITLLIFLLSKSLFSKPINFEGLSKFNLNDIQSITSLDIFEKNYEVSDINIMLKELSLSDLIYEISYKEDKDQYLFTILEANIIENIYINNNVWIRDDLIIQNLNSKNNSFLNKNKIQNDIKVINNIYQSKGFRDISVISKVEKYSIDRVNLIYELKKMNNKK